MRLREAPDDPAALTEKAPRIPAKPTQARPWPPAWWSGTKWPAIDCRARPGAASVSLPETLVILTADCTVRVKTVRIRVLEGGVR